MALRDPISSWRATSSARRWLELVFPEEDLSLVVTLALSSVTSSLLNLATGAGESNNLRFLEGFCWLFTGLKPGVCSGAVSLPTGVVAALPLVTGPAGVVGRDISRTSSLFS